MVDYKKRLEDMFKYCPNDFANKLENECFEQESEEDDITCKGKNCSECWYRALMSVLRVEIKE